jgi:hypothetical protein
MRTEFRKAAESDVISLHMGFTCSNVLNEAKTLLKPDFAYVLQNIELYPNFILRYKFY